MKPRLHLVGIFHTKHQNSYSHCAFTGKALRFPKMMQIYGYEVIEYSNEGSESTADEKVIMLSSEEFDNLFSHRKSTDFYGDDAVVGNEGHKLFESKIISALRERLQPQDIICHPFGHAHQILMSEFPGHQHVETGIGYPTLMPDSFRIFESYAWMHNHQSRENRSGRNYEWVVPNYYDLDDWQPKYEHGEYIAFLGRISSIKGLDTIRAIADYSPYPIILHGQGDPSPWSHSNIHYKGPIHGKERSDFLRNARAMLAPSMFIEPFCGMTVEAMLCGTPVITVDYGAMTETVQDGMGFRCHTLKDWVNAVYAVGDLDRKYIADTARSKYSLEACGKKYDKIFMQLNDIHRKGWYEVDKPKLWNNENEPTPITIPKRKRVALYTQSRWAFGAIHSALCKELYEYDIDADLLDWTQSYTQEEWNDFNRIYDLFVTIPADGVASLVNANIPYSKIIAIAHGERDIDGAIHFQNDFDSLLAYAAVSPSLIEYSKKQGISREMKLLRNGIVFDRFYQPIASNLSTLGYSGSLDHYSFDNSRDCKRSHLVSQLAEKLNLPLHLAQDGSNRSYLRMPEYYSKVDCIIVSSNESESCALPLMEAAAAGRLPISARIGITKDFDNPPGLILPLNEDEFVAEGVERIKELINNSQKFRTMCQEAQDFAREHYDWKAVVGMWADLLTDP